MWVCKPGNKQKLTYFTRFVSVCDSCVCTHLECRCRMPRGRPSGPFCRAGTWRGLGPRRRSCRNVSRSIWRQWRGGRQRSSRRSSWWRGIVRHACVRSGLVASWSRVRGGKRRWSSPDGKLLSHLWITRKFTSKLLLNHLIDIANAILLLSTLLNFLSCKIMLSNGKV